MNKTKRLRLLSFSENHDLSVSVHGNAEDHPPPNERPPAGAGPDGLFMLTGVAGEQTVGSFPMLSVAR